MQDLNVNLIPEKNRLAATGALLYLIDAHFGETVLYLTTNPAPVVFDGRTYAPFPASPESMKVDGLGGLSPVNFQISIVSREVVAYLESGDINGSPVLLRIVHSDHLADPDAVVSSEQYEITDAQIRNDMFVTLTCGHDRLLSHLVPAGRFVRDACRWRYKAANECGYSGALATCSKRLEGPNGCRAHGNVERFGGWPTLVAPR